MDQRQTFLLGQISLFFKFSPCFFPQYVSRPLRVEFLLKTDSGYSKDTGVTLFTLTTLGNPLRYNTHRSAPPVSALCYYRDLVIQNWPKTP